MAEIGLKFIKFDSLTKPKLNSVIVLKCVNLFGLIPKILNSLKKRFETFPPSDLREIPFLVEMGEHMSDG